MHMQRDKIAVFFLFEFFAQKYLFFFWNIIDEKSVPIINW
jgi:hypothetical protein